MQHQLCCGHQKKSACILVYCFNGRTKCGKISHENSCCLFKLFMVRVKWRIYSSFAFVDALYSLVIFLKFSLSLTFWMAEHASKLNILGSVWIYTYQALDWYKRIRWMWIHNRVDHFIEWNINCLKFAFANQKLSNRQFIEAIKTSF